MNKSILFLIAAALLAAPAMSQKIAYVESQSILEAMPEYQKANQEIEQKAAQWEEEVKAKFNEVETLYQNYMDSERMLSEEMRQQKQEEIFEAERKAQEFKEKKFGIEGELFQLREEKIKPLQEKIYQAAEDIAKANGYDFIFDKGPDVPWIYTNPEHNLTDELMEDIGLE